MREKKVKQKVEIKKRNAYKRKIITRREEREIRKGNGIAFTEGIEDLDKETDNESISTLAPKRDMDNINNNNIKDDGNYLRSDVE